MRIFIDLLFILLTIVAVSSTILLLQDLASATRPAALRSYFLRRTTAVP